MHLNLPVNSHVFGPCKPCNNITNFLAEVIVVVLESEEALISDAVHKCFETDIKIDVVPIPDNSAMGTADSLRHIKDKIKVKVMLLVDFEDSLLPLHSQNLAITLKALIY